MDIEREWFVFLRTESFDPLSDAKRSIPFGSIRLSTFPVALSSEIQQLSLSLGPAMGSHFQRTVRDSSRHKQRVKILVRKKVSLLEWPLKARCSRLYDHNERVT